jgi:hypothetical protein
MSASCYSLALQQKATAQGSPLVMVHALHSGEGCPLLDASGACSVASTAVLL